MGVLQGDVSYLTNPTLHTALPIEPTATQLPGMFQRYRGEINGALRSRLSRSDLGVYDMLRYYMGWADVDGNPDVATEGKALRPTLCLFACEATGGTVQQAMPAAVALEYIHNFSLIHDDIQDGDATRHHRDTLWAIWGTPRALVAGNILRVVADGSLERLVEEGLLIDRALGIAGLLTEAYLEMIEGQYLDISYEGRPDIGMRDYLAMIALKTGALIRCSLTLGAAVGTRDAATIEAFRACGTSLGYVFQIRDDVLGVWGDEETTGKPVGADVRRKKNSFPVVHAMFRAEERDRQLVMDIYRKETLTDSDVATVLDVMEAVDTRGHAQSLAAEHCDRALEALAGVELDPDMRRDVEELAHFLLVREH